MTDYLVDNSVWSRLASGDPDITARLRRIERAPADLFVTCPPQVLEFCHIVRTPEEHERYREQVSLGFPLEHAPGGVFGVGYPERRVELGTCPCNALALHLDCGFRHPNDATVLAADHDFDHIARMTELSHEYVCAAVVMPTSQTALVGGLMGSTSGRRPLNYRSPGWSMRFVPAKVRAT